MLSEIIFCHGQQFASVLDLPFDNDGVETGDVAHPRLVASLLRLGDLLDLDDGRHCPTQLLAVGKLPALSRAHLEKHRSIVSKSVTANSIEIRAKCQTFNSFEVQNDWFEYIEKEIEDQDRHWGDIAPEGYIGKLPTIRGLICDLEDSIPMGRKASRFSLDTNRVYEFLIGKSIYENPLACIHEVLQNSVDAAIDRIWIENQEKIVEMKSFRDLTTGFTIDVVVTPKEISGAKVEYYVEVSDSGKGMTLDDIKSILTVASEQGQNRKQISRQGMPPWMQPSGFFGIGLQSVFSVAEEIQIETQSASDIPYEIVIRSTQGKTPSFVVKKKSGSRWKFGTTVKFALIENAIPDCISGHLAITETLAKFDPLQDAVLTAKQTQIKEQVAEFAQFCEFKITFNGSTLERYRDQFSICDPENGIEYAIEFKQQAHINDWQYRGRQFKTNSQFKYFNIRGNIISERADSFLSLSREKIHPDGKKLLEAKVIASIKEKKTEILTKIEDRPMASFFYFLHDTPIDESWKTINLAGKSLAELLVPRVSIYISFESHESDTIDELKGAVFVSNRDGCAELLRDAALKLGYGVVIQNIVKHKFPDPYLSSQTRQVVVYQIQFETQSSLSTISSDAIKFLSNQKLNDSRERYWLPCGQDQFPSLSIPSENEFPWILRLTPFYDFFPNGIVLRATSKSLEADIPVLTKVLQKHKVALSESKIEADLMDFYKSYPFNPKHEKRNFFGPRKL